jgi:LDH2 family malate/lactate/ureidoglycolate dehydrogenase
MNVIGTAGRLTALCVDVFERLGSVREEARRVAVSLVDANLAGYDSRSVNQMPLYTK